MKFIRNTNTNNSWGFGGKISKTFQIDGTNLYKEEGRFCYRHTPPSRFVSYFIKSSKGIERRIINKPKNNADYSNCVVLDWFKNVYGEVKIRLLFANTKKLSNTAKIILVFDLFEKEYLDKKAKIERKLRYELEKKLETERIKLEKLETLKNNNLKKWSTSEDLSDFPKNLIRRLYDRDQRVLFGNFFTKGVVTYPYVDGIYTTDGIPYCLGSECIYNGVGGFPEGAELVNWDDLPKRFPKNKFVKETNP